MNQILFYFDGVLVDTPNGSISITLERDDEIRGLIKTFSIELTYYGTAYSALLDAFNNNNILDFVSVQIDRINSGDVETVFTGKIFVNEVEFDLSRQTASATIQDGTFYGIINNNKKIKARLNADRAKNGTSITAVTFRDIDFFTPSSGTYTKTDRDCVTVFDAFNYMIDFMSDGAVTFSSSYFDTAGDGEGVVICTGSAINNNTNVNPYISFYDLFLEMSKLFNLSFRIDSPYTAPEMVIEPTEDLYSNLVSLTLSDVNGLKMSFDRDAFYGIINVGSSTTQDDDAGSFSYPDGYFYGHKNEEYHVLSNANIDNSLDLVNKWVIDSNVIEDVVVNSVTSYDEDIFVVETNYPTADADALQFDNFAPGSTPVVYNYGLNNLNKTLRWLGSVPNDIAQYLSNGDNTFSASKDNTQALAVGTNTIIFNTEASDPGANYDTATGKFTAPSDGAYSFESVMPPITPAEESSSTEYYLRQYNSGGTLIKEVLFGTINWPDDYDNGTLLDEYVGSATFYMTATDYAVVELDLAGGSASAGAGTFLSSGNSIDGGVLQFYDPGAYRAILLTFSYPLTKTQYDTIFENPQKRIKITHFGDEYYGWIKSLEWNLVTGMADIVLEAAFSVLS